MGWGFGLCGRGSILAVFLVLFSGNSSPRTPRPRGCPCLPLLGPPGAFSTNALFTFYIAKELVRNASVDRPEIRAWAEASLLARLQLDGLQLVKRYCL